MHNFPRIIWLNHSTGSTKRTRATSFNVYLGCAALKNHQKFIEIRRFIDWYPTEWSTFSMTFINNHFIRSLMCLCIQSQCKINRVWILFHYKSFFFVELTLYSIGHVLSFLTIFSMSR